MKNRKALLAVPQIFSYSNNSYTTGDASRGVVTIPSGTKVNMHGSILQVKQTVFKGTFINSTANTYVEVEGLRANITPKFANSAIIISAHVHTSSQYWQQCLLIGKDKKGQSYTGTDQYSYFLGIQSNGSKYHSLRLGAGGDNDWDISTHDRTETNLQFGAPQSFANNVSNRYGTTMMQNLYHGGAVANGQYHLETQTMTLFDYPNTIEEVKYKIYQRGYDDTYATYVNRSHVWQNTSSYDKIPISTITLMEIGGFVERPATQHASYLTGLFNTD